VLQFDRVSLDADSQVLRQQVRDFIEDNHAHLPKPNSDFVTGHDPEFSQKLGEQGWIGMTWPEAFGGGDKTNFERLVVTEELLAAGAPVSAHWIADRQSGPLLLRFGTEEQRQEVFAGHCPRRKLFFDRYERARHGL
jgi:alkylation response protein AidB-like acyl-CoA dehydrogenase